jgi:hypothetical protein
MSIANRSELGDDDPMDNAVALVRTYLQLNGYFSITEYPVVTRTGDGGYRSLTDVDVMGFHFPYGDPDFVPDTALQVPHDRPDLIIGEVKEGKAVINESAADPTVLAKVLRRFGWCSSHESMLYARELVNDGIVQSNKGHQIRLAAFGSSIEPGGAYLKVTLKDVVAFIDRYIDENWEAVKQSGAKDEVFGFMLLLSKARGLTPGPRARRPVETARRRRP